MFEPASKQNSSCSSVSTDSGYESESSFPDPGQRLQPPVFNFYGNVIPLNDHEKPIYFQPTYAPAVTAY